MESTKKKRLSIDVGIISSLGRNSIKVAIRQPFWKLIKNSYDAGSTLVDIQIMSQVKEFIDKNS